MYYEMKTNEGYYTTHTILNVKLLLLLLEKNRLSRCVYTACAVQMQLSKKDCFMQEAIGSSQTDIGSATVPHPQT